MSSGDKETQNRWSERWLIFGCLGCAAILIVVWLVALPNESWLFGIGMLIGGVGTYGVIQELVGSVVGLLEKTPRLFLLLIGGFFASLIAYGYFVLIAS